MRRHSLHCLMWNHVVYVFLNNIKGLLVFVELVVAQYFCAWMISNLSRKPRVLKITQVELKCDLNLFQTQYKMT